MKKAVMNFILLGALFYAGFLGLLYVTQRQMIYFPDKTPPAHVPEGVEAINVMTKDGLTLQAWFIPAVGSKPTIILFHGNAGNYSHRIYKAAEYAQKGYGVLLAEYRGYGGNDGNISEQGFYVDGRAYMDFLMNDKKIPAEKIVVYGESIGTGTATQIAMEYDVTALILETPFSSLEERAQMQYFFVPVKYLLKDKFMNIEKIDQINAPLLIMHGKKDEVIPFSLAQKLFDKAKMPKVFHDFPQANHNNLYEFGASAVALDFLASINLQNADNIP